MNNYVFPITLDIDYKIEFGNSTSTLIQFEPGTHQVFLPISIIEDNIPEMSEEFELYITAIDDGPSVVVPFGGDHVRVNIEDNDGKLNYVYCQWW